MREVDRREFLATLILTPVAFKLLGCSETCGYGSDCAGEGEAEAEGEGCAVQPGSTKVSGHTHTVCVEQGDLDNPPAGGATYTTSSTGHTHTVALTQADLESIAGGGSVTITSSSSGGHTHEFAIALA